MSGRGITNAANRLSSERVLKFTRDGKWAEGVEPGPDGIHYRTECAYELGRRYAHEMQMLLK